MPRVKIRPTPELRQRVKSLAGFGMSQQQICKLVGLRSRKTLRKYFRQELELGAAEALANVHRTAFRLATSGQNPWMTRKWLERRAKWSPGLLCRDEMDEPQDVRFVFQEYQPPMPDDDPRRALIDGLASGSAKDMWEGDDPQDTD